MLCPRRYGIPHIAIVMYHVMSDYPNCAPSPNGGLAAQEGGFVSQKRFSTEHFLNGNPVLPVTWISAKKGIDKKDYFLGLSASYSARMGAMVFVDMDRRTSVVSFRQ
jgi:hypothetical protein